VSLSRTVSEIFSVNNGVTLKFGYGRSSSLEMAPLNRPHTSSYWRSVVIMALSIIISDITRGGRKSRFFHTLPAFDASVGWSPWEHCDKVWYGKTRMVWLRDGNKRLRIRLLVSTEYTNLTDSQTDTARRQRHELLSFAYNLFFKKCAVKFTAISRACRRPECQRELHAVQKRRVAVHRINETTKKAQRSKRALYSLNKHRPKQRQISTE